jgi:putative transposase
MLKISLSLLPHFKGFCSFPSEIMLFLYMKPRFSLSYRELEEMMMIRGTMQRWGKRFARPIDARERALASSIS